MPGTLLVDDAGLGSYHSENLGQLQASRGLMLDGDFVWCGITDFKLVWFMKF